MCASTRALTPAMIRLAYLPDSVSLEVRDDGCGLARHDGGGFGLVGIRERVEGLGGSLDRRVDPGHRRDRPRRGAGMSADRPVRVLVVDDQTLFREALTTLLEVREEVEVVGAAADGAQALELVARCDPTSCSWTCGCRCSTASRRRGGCASNIPTCGCSS